MTNVYVRSKGLERITAVSSPVNRIDLEAQIFEVLAIDQRRKVEAISARVLGYISGDLDEALVALAILAGGRVVGGVIEVPGPLRCILLVLSRRSVRSYIGRSLRRSLGGSLRRSLGRSIRRCVGTASNRDGTINRRRLMLILVRVANDQVVQANLVNLTRFCISRRYYIDINNNRAISNCLVTLSLLCRTYVSIIRIKREGLKISVASISRCNVPQLEACCSKVLTVKIRCELKAICIRIASNGYMKCHVLVLSRIKDFIAYSPGAITCECSDGSGVRHCQGRSRQRSRCH